MEISFAKNGNWCEKLTQAYSFRFTETPDFTQKEDCITTAVNPNHREGFDNISLLSKEKYGVGVCATLHCQFDDVGCPEIILVENLEDCADGAVRYGACFETVLWKNGINVWRHYRDDGKCHWHLRLGLTYPVAEATTHELTVQVQEQALSITLNGQNTVLRTEDLPERFHIGITACEGIVRLYDLKIEA
ncbi:MAG: hypothetical protein E7462_02280 [Ruminococcaceae bacterium]|nr:hypothetical protein [Oscillospiraceae bacterium]